MGLGKTLDAAVAKAIQEDMAEIDDKQLVQLATEEPKPAGGPCDCIGGPGRDNQPGTGLVDDYTVCPKCQGSGIL